MGLMTCLSLFVKGSFENVIYHNKRASKQDFQFFQPLNISSIIKPENYSSH